MSISQAEEGVIKFRIEHTKRPLPTQNYLHLITKLAAWRRVFKELKLLGQDDSRYGGAGFGNLSARVHSPSSPSPQFLITGTQTGAHPRLTPTDYSLVSECRPEENLVVSSGECKPSAESMTHSAFYSHSPEVSFVFHLHCPPIWKKRHKLGLTCTPENIPYGTIKMAREIHRLLHNIPGFPLIAMSGHEDGIIAFGPDAHSVGELVVGTLARALALELE